MEETGKNKKFQWLKITANLLLGAGFVFLWMILTSSPAQAVNNQITFQGKLTNASGNTVSNGTYYLKLTIYDASTGGSCQYTASSTCSSVTSTPVTVTNGIFSINLGDTSASLAAISPTLFNNSSLYLGITVCSGPGTGCDSEMTPRKRLTAAPYAFNADYLSGLATSTIGGQSSYVPVTDSSGNLKISNSVFIATTTAGQFGVGTSTVPSGMKSYVESTRAADKLLVIRANSSQIGNLQEWQNSDGVALVTINPSGNVSTSGTLAVLSAASSTISSALGINSSTPSMRLVVNGGSDSMVAIFEQNLSSNTNPIFTLINYDGANSDKGLEFVLPGGSTGGTIQGLSAANRASIRATSDSLVIGAGATVDALAFSLNNTPVLVFNGVGSQAIFKSFNVVLDDGTTTTTITKNTLTLGVAANYNAGVFSINEQGIVKSSGTITAIGLTSSGNLTVNGATTLGDSDAAGGDTTRIYGSLAVGAAPTGNAQLFLKASSTTAVPLLIQNESGGTIGQFSSSSANIIINGVQWSLPAFSLLRIGNSSGQPGAINLLADESTTGLLTIYRTATSIGSQLISGSLLLASSSNTSTLTSNSLILGQGSGYNRGVFYIDSSGVVNASGSITTAGNLYASGITVPGAGLTTTGVLNVTGNTELGNNSDVGGDWIAIYGSLAMGAVPIGNAMVYLKATSTTAVPLLIQDNSGNAIGKFASSSVEAIINGAQVTVNNYSLLTLGNANGKAGVLSVRTTDSASPGAIILYRDATAVGAQLTPGTLIVSGSGGTTSTLDTLSLTLTQKANYNRGVFYVDDSGNTSVSGTLKVFQAITLNMGVISPLYISPGGDATSSISSNSLYLGDSNNNGVGIFNVSAVGNVNTSGTVRIFGGASTGGLSISATNSTTTFTSFATSTTGNGAGAFVLDTNSLYSNTSVSSILLSIRTNGSAKFSFSANGNAYAVGTFTSNGGSSVGDFAEVVDLVSDEEVEAGDIIVVDAAGFNQYRKSTSAYAQNIAGVITDTGRFIIGESGAGKVTLSLAGLVKTKVSDENGPINAGDYLVSASLPGFAMKYDFASGKTAGIVGMALESLAEGTGKIIILVNKSPISGNTASLNVSQNNYGQLAQTGDLDLGGHGILNVKKIISQNEKWMINEDGYLVVKVSTAQGDKKLYGLQSGQDKELVLSGSSQLENGLKKIELPLIDQDVIDPTATIKVSVTLTGEAKGVFVSEKNYQGFIVKELGGGTSNATFDWMLIAKRRPADYQSPAVSKSTSEISEIKTTSTVSEGAEDSTLPSIIIEEFGAASSIAAAVSAATTTENSP